MKNSHTSYERYKAKLHAIFDGRAPLPDHLREANSQGEEEPKKHAEKTQSETQIGEKPATSKTQRRLSPSSNPHTLFVEALKKASTPDEMRRAVSAIREAGLELPHDEDLLSKVLTYPDETVVLDVLAQLESLLKRGAAKNPRLLVSRLDDAAFECRPGQAMDRILRLKEKLKS